MPTERPNTLIKPPPTTHDMATAVVQGWFSLWRERPTMPALTLLLGHSSFETGWWASMHCFNLGNAKSVEGDGYDYTYFACSEVINGVERHFSPAVPSEKPYCRWRAFGTLHEGVIDYLMLLRRRFGHAWPALLTGDAVTFCTRLKEQHYFTADLRVYTGLCAERTKIVRARLQYFEIDKVVIELTEAEKAQALALVGATLSITPDADR